MANRIAFVSNALTGPELVAGKRDAALMYSMLTDPALGCCSSALSPAPLHDCSSREVFSSRLTEATKAWNEEDQLVLYFSGHGETKAGKFVLVFGTDDDKSYLPFDNVLADLQIRNVTRAVLILDACQSGAALGGRKGEPTLTSPTIDTEDLPKGIALLASSRGKQSSFELSDGSASLFTHLVIEGISSGLSGDTTHDQKISVGDLAGYIQKRLESDYSKYPQTPMFSVEHADRSIWISRNRSEAADVDRPIPPISVGIRTAEELRFLYETTAGSRHPCPNATIDDLDHQLVRKLLDEGENDSTSEVTMETLQRLGLTSPIDIQLPHKAAVLCFAHHPERFYPQARSIFVVGEKSDRNFTRRDVTGPLPTQYRTLVDAVENALSRQGLPTTERTRRFLLVVREAISNAVAHRDYDATGVTRVSVVGQRVEVVSPGEFPGDESWQSLLSGEHLSTPTDAAIAWYLTRLLAFEGMGRGFAIYDDFIRESAGMPFVCEVVGSPPSIQLVMHLTDPADGPDPFAETESGVGSADGPDPFAETESGVGSAVTQEVELGRVDPPFPAFTAPPSSEQTCSNCSRANAANMKFCLGCGALLKFSVPPSHVVGSPSQTSELDGAPNIPRLVFERLIGKGGSGSVYLARDVVLDRNVAVKVVSERFETSQGRARFLREAQIGAKLKHPAIIQVLDVGEVEDQIYIVFEYVEGLDADIWAQSLHEHTSQTEHLTEVVHVIRNIANALSYAHKEGVVHRDVKPANILVTHDGLAKLSDFGIAGFKETEAEQRLTQTGSVIGTPAYIAPEAFSNVPPDERADIYGLGVSLIELVTGEDAFQGKSTFEVISMKVTDSPFEQLKSDLFPKELADIAHKATMTDPEMRYQTVEAFGEALTNFLRKLAADTNANK